MSTELVFATNNRHKIEEVAAAAGSGFKLLTLDDIGCFDEIEETGNTFNANASIKSRFIFDKYNISCFGDDSGLMVDSLNGEPGVYSARYAGKHGDHAANIRKVLDKLGEGGERRARFITVISLIWNGNEHFFEGVLEGQITPEPIGDKGFGYDPIFKPEGFEITLAQMTMEEKNRISHRARAVQKLVSFLQSITAA